MVSSVITINDGLIKRMPCLFKFNIEIVCVQLTIETLCLDWCKLLKFVKLLQGITTGPSGWF